MGLLAIDEIDVSFPDRLFMNIFTDSMKILRLKEFHGFIDVYLC